MAFQFSTQCESYYNLRGQKGLPHWLDTSSAISKQTTQAKALLLTVIPVQQLNLRTGNAGWVKNAIILAYYYLLRYKEFISKPEVYGNRNFYHDCLRQVIKEGGDADTNACIVGGLLGALVGIKSIPEHMINKVVEFDCELEEKRRKRPEFLSTKKYAV